MKPFDASEQTIFDAARQIAGAPERAAYLDEACAGDPKLRERVEALLHASARADQFLAGDPLQLGEWRPAIPAAPPASEGPGTVIDKYKLLERLGEGGCGVVYMAEQEEPVRRRVALKIIKLGMDTRSVIARFEAEHQALALMDHPHIAKVLDAGAAETGRPYFVMELVGGIKITDYCEQNHLDTRQRLDLFIQVCHAIQHAHQKGVIHRDIKPSNVLVATQDGVAVPKVIDFGIAKATQGRLADDTVFTAFEQFLGTPAYMSPEQAQVGGLDVDTRSDIYSLGVLLYELLTGKTPFDAKELLASGLEAMRRTIQEKEPPTPSTRLAQELVAADMRRLKTTTSDAPDSGKEIRASSRRLLQGREVHALRGDLDWIVMKCLEKNRTRRYETANGLATDLQRYLSNEPVAASPPSKLYRFQKLVRRNKGAVGTAVALATVLILAASVSTWQARQQSRLREKAQTAQANEVRQRQKAETEATKSQQVATFLKDMLEGVGPSKALGRDTTMLKEILDKTAERLGKDLTNQPAVEIELRDILARTYEELALYHEMNEMGREELRLARSHSNGEDVAVARALQVFADAQIHLGDYEQAENCARGALEIYEKLYIGDNQQTAGAMISLATALHSRSKLAEAEAIHRNALAMLRKALGNEHVLVAESLGNLSFVLLELGKLAEAEALGREALGMLRKLHGNEHPTVAIALNNLGLILAAEAKFAEEESLQRQALEMRRKLLGNEHPDVGQSLHNLAISLQNQNKLSEAESAVREALTVSRRRLGNEHRDVGFELNTLGTVLKAEGKLAEAEATHRQTLELRRKLLGPDHLDIATSLNNLALTLRAEGKLAEAEAAHREALAMRRKLVGEEHAMTTFSRGNLAFVLEEEGRLAEAEALYRESLAIQRKLFEPGHPELTRTLNHIARVLLRQDKYADAEPFARECLSNREKESPDDWATFNVRRLVGSSLLGQKKYAESEPLLVSGYEGMKQRESKIPANAKGRLKEAIEALEQLYEATGRTNQSAAWKQKFEEFERAQTNRVAPSSAHKP